MNMANTTSPNFDEMSRSRIISYLQTLQIDYNIQGLNWQRVKRRREEIVLFVTSPQPNPENDVIRVPDAPHVELPDFSNISDERVVNYAKDFYQSYTRLKYEFNSIMNEVSQIQEHVRRDRRSIRVVTVAPPLHLMPSANIGEEMPSYEESFRDSRVDPRVAPPTYEEAIAGDEEATAVGSSHYVEPSAPPAPDYMVPSAPPANLMPENLMPPSYPSARSVSSEPVNCSIFGTLRHQADDLKRERGNKELVKRLRNQKPLPTIGGVELPPLQVYCLLTQHNPSVWGSVLAREAFQDISDMQRGRRGLIRRQKGTEGYGWALPSTVLDQLNVELGIRGMETLQLA